MEKIHTTNYYDTFIEIAEDSPIDFAEIPLNIKPTVASLQYDMVSKNPYLYTSDEVIFKIHALKNDISEQEREEANKQFFSKGQPCFRASALGKRYGFGIHYNEEGKMALYGAETIEYKKYLEDETVKKLKAMRSKKK